ncbi:MAG: GrpB family protein [Armatimonadota bacterium]|nr:GrpB family protein [Armatimonadota bacterium]
MTQRPPIQIVEYDSRWLRDFAVLRDALTAALGAVAVAVEHVGSTSVPDLAAKPIIDIDVVIESREQLPDLIAILGTLGYAHEGARGIPGREAFGTEDRASPPHHLYVCAQDCAELARHLALRDYLRRHPGDARAYGELKRTLARRFLHNIDAYVEGKTAFLENILRICIPTPSHVASCSP